MSAGAVLAIAVPILVVLAIVVFATTARRDRQAVAGLTREAKVADRSPVDVVDTADVEAEARERYAGMAEVPPAGAVAVPPRDPEEVGITRRQLFNRGIVLTGVVSLSGFGAAILAFLWPSGAGGFGSKISAGSKDEILGFIGDKKAPFYVPEARAYLQPYPKDALPKAKKVYDPRIYANMEQGLVALYQKCVHLGCRVPWCQSSQWFECPCHGSKYNRVGEKKGGPAPRGLDRFPIEFAGGKVTIDTGTIVTGPPIGTNTTGQEAEGPNCV